MELFGSYDIIGAVPINKERQKERGYNQSTLIAKDLARYIPNLIYKEILKKTINNKRQSELKKEERLKNVKNVYEIQNSEIIQDKKVILFDDIYTTGSTVNECSRVLKENGAKEILILTLASGN